MTVTRGNRQLRSFAIVSVQKEDGCPSKFNPDSRFVGSTPKSAAQKAFTRLCNLKKVKGKCTFIITMEDTTRGHARKGKKYTYKVDRKKLDKPIVLQKGTPNEYKIRFAVSARKNTVRMNPKKNCKQTSGPMKKSTPRKYLQENAKKRSLKKKSNNNNKTVGNRVANLFK